VNFARIEALIVLCVHWNHFLKSGSPQTEHFSIILAIGDEAAGALQNTILPKPESNCNIFHKYFQIEYSFITVKSLLNCNTNTYQLIYYSFKTIDYLCYS